MAQFPRILSMLHIFFYLSLSLPPSYLFPILGSDSNQYLSAVKIIRFPHEVRFIFIQKKHRELDTEKPDKKNRCKDTPVPESSDNMTDYNEFTICLFELTMVYQTL